MVERILGASFREHKREMVIEMFRSVMSGHAYQDVSVPTSCCLELDHMKVDSIKASSGSLRLSRCSRLCGSRADVKNFG